MDAAAGAAAGVLELPELEPPESDDEEPDEPELEPDPDPLDPDPPPAARESVR